MAAIKVYRTHQKRTWRGDGNWDWYMGPEKKIILVELLGPLGYIIMK
jgi:hypothetical protein